MNQEKFHLWLRQCGAEVLAPTNPFEFARFRAKGSLHVIYQNQHGRVTWPSGFAEQCLNAFENKQRLSMGIVGKLRRPISHLKAALATRDGEGCFFCGKLMTEEEMTIEHLVSRHKGGPDHMDNLGLAHDACNKEADNLPLVEKIKMRERLMGLK